MELERVTRGGARLDTDQLDITNHSDRCLKAFYCSSAVSDSCSIDSCPNGGHPCNMYIVKFQLYLKYSNYCNLIFKFLFTS